MENVRGGGRTKPGRGETLSAGTGIKKQQQLAVGKIVATTKASRLRDVHNKLADAAPAAARKSIVERASTMGASKAATSARRYTQGISGDRSDVGVDESSASEDDGPTKLTQRQLGAATRKSTGARGATRETKANTGGATRQGYLNRMTRDELLELVASQKDEIARLQSLLSETSAAAASAAAAAAAAHANRVSMQSEDVNPMHGRFPRTFVVDGGELPGVDDERLAADAQRGIAFEYRHAIGVGESELDAYFVGSSGTDSEAGSVVLTDVTASHHPHTYLSPSSSSRRKGALTDRRDACTQAETSVSNASVQAGQMDVSRSKHVSVLVADCTSRIVSSLETVYTMAMTKIRRNLDGGGLSTRSGRVSEDALYACVHAHTARVVKEMASIAFVLEDAMTATRSRGIMSAFQKHAFGVHVAYPRVVIESMLAQMEKDLVALFDPSTHDGDDTAHDGSSRRILAVLYNVKASLEGRLVRMERNLLFSLRNAVEDVRVLCRDAYAESVEAFRTILDRTKEAVDEKHMFQTKGKVSELRMRKMTDALESADARVSRCLRRLQPSLVYATWEAATEGEDVARDLRDCISRSRDSLAQAMSSTSRSVAASLYDVDVSAASGMAHFLLEARKVASGWENLVLEMSMGLATAGDGHMSAVIAGTVDGARLLCAELLSCAGVVHALLASAESDNAAWLSAEAAPADAIAAELAAMTLCLSRCEEKARHVMVRIAWAFQSGILLPKVAVSSGHGRDMPSLSLEGADKVDAAGAEGVEPADGTLLSDHAKASVLAAFARLANTVKTAAERFGSAVLADCDAVLGSKGSMYPTLEEGLKRFMRSVKVVRRKYVEGAAALLEGASLVFAAGNAAGSVALRRRVPPPPPYLVVAADAADDCDDKGTERGPDGTRDQSHALKTSMHESSDPVSRADDSSALLPPARLTDRAPRPPPRRATGPVTNLFTDDDDDDDYNDTTT